MKLLKKEIRIYIIIKLVKYFLINYLDQKEIYNSITQTHLSLRKNKLDSILASKRKISLNYIGDNLNNYKIKIEELNIPQQFQINIYQFFENVRLNL